ncbi:MAG TPA: 30S ribosomal protein S7 [Candidatus Saccharimonadales bacterium]|nr:30S ribosomal protein S7 [Candidatus Saccharimonadales bacterium]
MRHKKVVKREIQPDKLYKSVLVARFINRIMVDGKKTVAEGLVYAAFETLKAKGEDPLKIFERALQSVAPRQEIKARRVGGANYQVPIEVRGERKTALSIRWIIEAAQKRSNKEFHTFDQKLVAEFMDAIESKGEAVKKRDNMHRQAEANKAFAHFRW